MREIKFRVFVGGKFYYWGFSDDGHGVYFMGVPSTNIEPLNFAQLQERSQQYTGLTEKNGVEIYEGDMLTPSNYKKATGADWEKFKVEVVFYKGMFCLKPNKFFIDEHAPLYISLEKATKLKNDYLVIGNIHEDKGLLDG